MEAYGFDHQLGPGLVETEASTYYYTPLYNSIVVIGVTLLAMIVMSIVLPSSRPFQQLDQLFVAPPREAERRRIRRLILPPEALRFSEQPGPAAQPQAPQREASQSMIQRVSETVSTAATLAGRWQQSTSKWQHTWTFHPTTQAARDCTPLLVFVNRGSGGRQGEATLVQMRALLSAQQVIDLSGGHAESALQSFHSIGRFRVLVCGGDGTVAWVLSLLDEAQLAYTPPVAILPLGTGNDLARALGWGGSAPGRPFVQLIEEVDQAQVALLDRWQVSFEHARVPKSLSSGRKKKLGEPDSPRAARSLILQNYLGIGVDAKVALEFHKKRQTAPQLFSSRFWNKLHYANYGAKQLFRKNFAEVCTSLTLIADGVTLTLPPGTEGIIVLNIASYGGGSDLWGAELGDLWNAQNAESERESRESRSPIPRTDSECSTCSTSSGSDTTPPGAGAGGGAEKRGLGEPAGGDAGAGAASLVASAAAGGERTSGARRSPGHSRSNSGDASGIYGPDRRNTGTPPLEGFVPASMDDRMLEVDGEPFELEPIFAPRRPMSITINHHNQAVMLSRSSVRADGAALEAIDWAMQEGIISVEQRNRVVREVARRTGSLQRRSALGSHAGSGSSTSLASLGGGLNTGWKGSNINLQSLGEQVSGLLGATPRPGGPGQLREL